MRSVLRPSYVVRLLCALAAVVVCALVGPPVPAAPAPHPVGARIALGALPVRVGLDRAVAVTGVLTGRDGPVAGVAVDVELQTASGWVPQGRTAVTDARGRFSLAAPTFFYGRHVLRVVAPALAAASASRQLQVLLPYRPAGRRDAWRVDPTRFDPCAPIPFRINFAGAPRNARALVSAALRRARAATGLTFTYAGAYSGIPFSGQPDAGLPARGLGFAWGTPGQVPALSGDAIGLGGGGWSVGTRRLSAGVVIDRTFPLRRGWNRPNSVGGLLLHEIGHALGLEHVADRNQQMYPRDVGTRSGNYNRGDLTALRRLGLEGGCLGTGSGSYTRSGIQELPVRV